MWKHRQAKQETTVQIQSAWKQEQWVIAEAKVFWDGQQSLKLLFFKAVSIWNSMSVSALAHNYSYCNSQSEYNMSLS